MASLFTQTLFEPNLVSSEAGHASALKMTYAACSKGISALLLATRAVARAQGVEEALLAEWRRSQPDLEGRSEAAAVSAALKGWRWIGEMEEIASTFAGAGLPDGFQRAAAEVYRATPRLAGDAHDALVHRVLTSLTAT